jgi:broad specificity phosphatase PhoE
MCRLYVVRHGMTEWNKQGKIQGHTDIDLSPEGRLQAQALASQFREIPLAAVYASDLLRAKNTAAIMAHHHELEVNLEPSLRERCWGEWEGMQIDELRRDFAKVMEEFIENPTTEEAVVLPGVAVVETYRQGSARVIPCLLDIARSHQGKNVLVVTHGGILRGLMHFFGHHDLPRPAFHNGDYLVIESDGDQLIIVDTQGKHLPEVPRNI